MHASSITIFRIGLRGKGKKVTKGKLQPVRPKTHTQMDPTADEVTRLRAKRDRLEALLDDPSASLSMSEAKELVLRQQLIAVENQITALIASSSSSSASHVHPPTSSHIADTATNNNGNTAGYQQISSSPACGVLQSLRPWKLTECFGASAHGENDVALQHLETIIRNLMQNQLQEKYRAVRLGNEKLRKELFHVRLGDAASMMAAVPEEERAESAAEAFLSACGFRREMRPVHSMGTSNGDAHVEPWLVFALPPPTSPSTESFQRLTAALREIECIRQRDCDTRKHVAEFQSLRQSAVMEIRMDRLKAAMIAGETEAFCESLMLVGNGSRESRRDTHRDEEDDEVALLLLLENIKTLRRILENIAEEPWEDKYRRLRLGNKLVYRTLMGQCGGLEFLLGVAGFTLSNDGGVVLEGSADEAKQVSLSALDCLHRISATASQQLEDAKRRTREVAAMCARAEVDAEVKKTLKSKRHSSTASDPSCGGNRVRVPLGDAIKYLLGQETLPEVNSATGRSQMK